MSPLEGRSAQPGGSERASVSLGCASQQAPFPHAPVPPLRPAGLGEQTALSEDSVSSFWEWAVLCSFLSQELVPSRLSLGVWRDSRHSVLSFSAAAGRPTSLELEENQQPASVCFAPAIKRAQGSASKCAQGTSCSNVWRGSGVHLSTNAQLAAFREGIRLRPSAFRKHSRTHSLCSRGRECP